MRWFSVFHKCSKAALSCLLSPQTQPGSISVAGVGFLGCRFTQSTPPCIPESVTQALTQRPLPWQCGRAPVPMHRWILESQSSITPAGSMGNPWEMLGENWWQQGKMLAPAPPVRAGRGPVSRWCSAQVSKARGLGAACCRPDLPKSPAWDVPLCID